MTRALLSLTFASLLVVVGCSLDQSVLLDRGADSGGDGGADADAGADGGADAAADGGADGGADAGADGGVCVPPGSPETCNGLDDDCNGVVDDGAAACASTTGCGVHHRSDGNAYLVCEIDASWAAGSTLCSGVGHTLVTVTDASEESYLLGLMRMYAESQWWSGFCDLDGDGVYADDEWEGADSAHRNWQDMLDAHSPHKRPLAASLATHEATHATFYEMGSSGEAVGLHGG